MNTADGRAAGGRLPAGAPAVGAAVVASIVALATGAATGATGAATGTPTRPPAGTPTGAAAATAAHASAPAPSTGARPGAADTALSVELERGYPAVAAAELGATPIGALRREDQRILGQGPAGRTLEMRPGSPFLRHGGRVYQLSNPPYVEDGEARVPAELVTRWMPEITGGAAWEVEGRRLTRVSPFEDEPFRVIIDPGHGGRDPGAIGPRGRKEKQVTLAVARAIERALEREPRVEAILTRNRDTLIALQDRSEFAIQEGGDLFLSLHANASRARSARGFETYFLSPARTEEARQVALRENASVKYERGSDSPDLSELQFILADLDQDINVRESSRLAGYTQNQLRPVHSGPDRGVKQAGFLVLVGASGSMPAVLVEMGFLTNPNEARVLTSSQGQEKIAASIADAVVSYFDQYRHRLAGNRAGG